MPIQRFEPFPGSPEDRYFAAALRRPLVYFLVTFSYKRKSNVKTSLGIFWGGLGHAAKSNSKNVPFCLLFAETKSNTKNSLFRLFENRKAPIPSLREIF